MTIDISNLNKRELDDLISSAEARKKAIHQQRLAALRKQIDQLIKAEGYTFEDVYGTRSRGRSTTGKVPPKYFNPADPSVTWSGRGKRPNWFKAAISSGSSEADMLIK